VRQLDALDRRAELLGEPQACLEHLADAGLDARLVAAQRFRDAEANPVEALGLRKADGLGELQGRRVAFVAADHVGEQQRGASRTSRASGPAWSSDEAKAIIRSASRRRRSA